MCVLYGAAKGRLLVFRVLDTHAACADQFSRTQADGKLIVKGYIKSTSTYTKEEGKTFLKKCEDRYLIDLNGGIDSKEYMQHRKTIRG